MCYFSYLEQRWKRLPLAMLLLAFAVFGWGLHYKLTLYEQDVQVQATQPVAKLLSQRERGTANAVTTTESSMRPVDIVILIAFAIASLTKLVRLSIFRIAPQRRKALSALCETNLFMRPPPAAVSLF